MTSLSTIERRFRNVASTLAAPASCRTFRTTPHHDGSRHCEFDGTTYTLTTSERGTLFDSDATTDPDELLFWLVRDMTWQMASDHELKNRPDDFNGDSRIVLFDHHVELLSRIDENWAVRQRDHYSRILAEHPSNGG
ncbi:MAG: hypothetical protein GY904_10540 [Planctomycetaceae bacterium]|nr:hypothetical protein [Planctomycetaceae bacterium]